MTITAQDQKTINQSRELLEKIRDLMEQYPSMRLVGDTNGYVRVSYTIGSGYSMRSRLTEETV